MPSSEPFEITIDTFSIGFGFSVASGVTSCSRSWSVIVVIVAPS